MVLFKACTFANDGGVVACMVILVRLEQLAKALALICIIPIPMVILVSPVQPWNGPMPIIVTLSGIVMFVSPVHS